jgi:RHS repeat-associated protein
VGNRQIMDSPQGEISYSYDAANRLTSVDGVTYTWDDNGNLTSDGVRSYTYDHANRLTQVTQGSQTTQFAYNGDGVRTSKTVDGDTTQYVLDLAATLPVVVSDTEAVYLYGLDIIAQQQAERLYYAHDGLGSVRQLLDSTGEVQTNYAYDPFGVPVVAGDASNPYRFTGEAWDEEVELLYLRARYYQPETGRFITMDPWPGNAWQPTTLNRYVYVTNNPVNYVDPGGLDRGGPDGLGIERDELPHDYGIPGPSGVPGPGRGPLVGDQAELPYAYSVPPPSGVGGPGKGPLCPECHEALPGYSVFEAVWWAGNLVGGWAVEHWRVPEYLVFGPDHPLTQAVMRSPALAQFRRAWASPTEGGYQLPWAWEHSLEERDKGPLRHRLARGAVAYAREHLRLALFGDPTGVLLGSFNRITVNESESSSDMVTIIAYNVMGIASGTRVPGTRFHLPNMARSDWLPVGGTIYQWFYWEEAMPTGCWIEAFKRTHPVEEPHDTLRPF